jgi:undecaprenyl-diphosphatase
MDREPAPPGAAASPTGSRRAGRGGRAWAIGAAACATAFIVLAGLVLTATPFVRSPDDAVHDRLRAYSLKHPGFLAAMADLTHLGDTAVVALGVVILVVVTLMRGRRAGAIFVAAAAVAAYAVSRTARAALGRPRPADRLWEVTDAGFPSGHAANSAALAVIVVVLCWPLVGRAGRIALVAGASAYAGTVGLTRLAGAVHWLSDVVGGWLVATACVLTVAALTRPRS